MPSCDEGGLAAPGLVDRGVVGGAGGAAGGEDVGGELGALARLGGGEDLEAVAAAAVAPAAALGGADDGDGALLVEAEELGEAEVQAGGDAGGDGERRAGLPSLDL